MERQPQAPTGHGGGCLFNGCVVLCVLFVLTFAGMWIWTATQPARDEAAARADLRETVDERRNDLVEAAADGVLQDDEIIRLFPPEKPANGLVDVERRGETTTVTAGLLGHGPARAFIFVVEETVPGCYAFDVTPSAHGKVRVAARELPDDTCDARSAR
ncbi:hypothetical protein ACFRKB_21335 [Streptomyces scopuliridis]|uniref:hypothetical protein n=1 Tax=Streptomyces scopuliridis TaxID=452529 RepID=UPI0036C87B34